MKTAIITAVITTALSTLIASNLALATVIYSVTDLGVLSGSSEATAVNESAQVVGSSGSSSSAAFIWSNGTMSNLGSLGGGGSSFAQDINDISQVAGFSPVEPNGQFHPFIWENGVITDLGTLGGDSGLGLGINNAGKVVGTSLVTGNTAGNAFLWANGVMTDLQFSGVARDINDQDQIVGAGSPTASRGFLWDNGTLTDLGGLSNVGGTDAFAINNNTNIVGASNITNGNVRAFFWSEGVMLNLGTLGTGTSSIARGINDNDVVVGEASTVLSGVFHAFIWEAGEMIDLNLLIPTDSGFVLQNAVDINNRGEIVGTGFNSFGARHAYLLVPITVPEPGSLTLFATGLAGLGFMMRRRRRST